MVESWNPEVHVLVQGMSKAQGTPVLCPHRVTFQEGAGSGICSGSRVENAHSRSLLSCLCPEIWAVPFPGRPWCPCAAASAQHAQQQTMSRSDR